MATLPNEIKINIVCEIDTVEIAKQIQHARRKSGWILIRNGFKILWEDFRSYFAWRS